MEELHCKGTPAQVARRVLAVLAEDPDLLWLIDQYKDYPRPLPKALNELDGRRVPNELENWPVDNNPSSRQASFYRRHTSRADTALYPSHSRRPHAQDMA